MGGNGRSACRYRMPRLSLSAYFSLPSSVSLHTLKTFQSLDLSRLSCDSHTRHVTETVSSDAGAMGLLRDVRVILSHGLSGSGRRRRRGGGGWERRLAYKKVVRLAPIQQYSKPIFYARLPTEKMGWKKGE